MTPAIFPRTLFRTKLQYKWLGGYEAGKLK